MGYPLRFRRICASLCEFSHLCYQVRRDSLALADVLPTSTSSNQAEVVTRLRGGATPKACRLWLQRSQFHSQEQAKRVVRKAVSVLSRCDYPTSRARVRLLDSIGVDLRSGSTTASCCAALVRDKGFSRRHAQRIVRRAAVCSGVHSAASQRSHAVADTIESLLAGKTRRECSYLLARERGFTPKQLKTILDKAVLGAKQQQLHEEYCRAQQHDEANEVCDKNNGFAPGKAIHFLDLV